MSALTMKHLSLDRASQRLRFNSMHYVTDTELSQECGKRPWRIPEPSANLVSKQ